MSDPEKTIPPGKAQKILDGLDRGEDIAAAAAGNTAGWLAQHPHLALTVFILWTVFIAWAAFKVGRL